MVSALDLSAIYKSYQEKDGRGQAAYAPEMMVRLLLYGYAAGVYSSRKIQTRTFEDVAIDVTKIKANASKHKKWPRSIQVTYEVIFAEA